MTTIHPKVANATTAGTLAGACSVLIVWGLSFKGIVVPGDVAAAFTTLLTVGFGFIAGYRTPS